MGDAAVVDSMIRDGLWCACDDQHMGMTGELVAEKHGITREQQDAFALESHRRATMAWREGRFDAEVVPVALPAKKKGGEPVMFARDESVREEAVDDPAAALAALAAAAAGVQEGGHGDGGERSGSERCCGGGGGDVGGARCGVGDQADGDDPRAGDEWSRAAMGDAGSGARRRARAGAGGVVA